MYFKGLSVVFCFENQGTLDRVIKMYEDLGVNDFGKYISQLIEKDFYEKVVEEKVHEKVESTQQIDPELFNKLLSTMETIVNNGVPLASIKPINTPVPRETRAGDLSQANEIIKEIETEPIPVVKKSTAKKKFGGLKSKDFNAIAANMNKMTK